MDVTKAPPTTDLASFGVGTAVSSAAASQSSAAAGVSTASNASTTVTAAADRVDIQPLDVAAALQILIAEVRAELPLPGVNSPAGMALGEDLPEVAPQANTLPALQAAELVAAELLKADLVAAEIPGAVQTAAPPVADVARGPLPLTQVPMQEPLPEEALDLTAVLLGSAAAGAETPNPLAGDLSAGAGAAAAAAWPPPLSATPAQTSPGVAFSGTDPSAEANAGVDLAPLPAGPLPRVELPVIPPGLDLGPLEPLFMPPAARLSSPAQASPVLLRLFLQAVPDYAGNPARWSATVIQLEVTLQSALERAVAAVEQWRNVPQVVVDAARETRSLVMSQLSDDPPGPLWLRPEWMWLSPRMERFRRRRRLARRGLTDPDLWSLREDDTRQEKRGRRHDEP